MSSLFFLGISLITFIITYGIGFLILSSVLGISFSTFSSIPITDPKWAAQYSRTQVELQFLIPLAASLGIVLLVLKLLMTAGVRGRD